MIALLVNPHYSEAETHVKEVKEAAASIGQQILVLNASTESDIDMAFGVLVQRRAGALIWPTTLSFSVAEKNWSRWQHATRCPRFTVARVHCGRRPDELRNQYY